MTDKSNARLALEAEISDLLGRIHVRFHYNASAGGKVRLYAVFQSPIGYLESAKQLTEPMPHVEAQRHCRAIIAERIYDLFERGRPA
jgi:hypothetical protein